MYTLVPVSLRLKVSSSMSSRCSTSGNTPAAIHFFSTSGSVDFFISSVISSVILLNRKIRFFSPLFGCVVGVSPASRQSSISSLLLYPLSAIPSMFSTSNASLDASIPAFSKFTAVWTLKLGLSPSLDFITLHSGSVVQIWFPPLSSIFFSASVSCTFLRSR